MHDSSDWVASGVVSLTTDFGHVDAYVGTMKGALLRVHPSARPVDLTHEVAPQDVAAAAFHLRHAWRHFPAGSVHVVVVDPGVGTDRRILIAQHAGHAFLAPDNGLLPAVLGAAARDALALDLARLGAAVALGPVSATFHGRDLFAPAAALLARGVAPATLGAPLAAAPTPAPAEALVHDTVARGPVEVRVLHVDRFGNVVTNWAPRPAEAFDVRAWSARIGARRVPGASTYADVAPGEPLALLDSLGHVEIAIRDGDAARTLGLARGDRLFLEPQS